MSTAIRYFTDEQVAKAVADGLRKRGIDVLTVAQAKLLGATDEELLSFVRSEQRVLITQDQDFLRLAANASNHPGIVYAPQGSSIGELVRMLDLLYQISNMEQLSGRVESI